MMSSAEKLRVGDVVRDRQQAMIVIGVAEGEVLACPVVAGDEPRHRADLDLDRSVLAEAELLRLDVRVRAIGCVRAIGRVRRVGVVPAWLGRDVRKAARREQVLRDRERAAVVARGGLASGGRRAGDGVGGMGPRCGWATIGEGLGR